MRAEGRPDGTWRVSLRSLGAVDVRRIAADQGGGGHRFAAGFESTPTSRRVVARILRTPSEPPSA